VPAVAWDGTNYLVVWEDYRTGDADIWAARVSPTGSVLATFVVHEDWSYNDVQPDVSWNGSSFLVVWQTDEGYYEWGDQDVKGVRLSKTGGRLGNTFHVSRYGFSARPKVAAKGSQWLVVWENFDDWDVHGARVNGSGSLLDPFGITINTVGTDQRNLTVFVHASDYIVGWSDFRTGNSDVFYTPVSSGGTVANTTGIQVTNSSADDFGVRGASIGTQALLTWTSGGNVRGSRINSSKALIDGQNGFAIAATTAAERSPAVAKLSSSRWSVVWNQKGTTMDVKSRTVGGPGVLGTVVNVSSAAGDQLYPKIARGATNLLTVWQDGRNATTSNNDIWGRRLQTTGATSGAEFNIG
jgi:hypothetical protein